MGVRAARDEATLHQTARSPSPAFIFIEVGRLVEKKGHEYAIRAFARCRERCGDIDLRLIIIGAGPLEDRLRALAHRLALDAIIEFRGGQPRDAIFDALVHSNVLLLPSVTAADGDMEASPVAISEAMSVGLPVIATHHGGIPEIVEDGGTGILVPERDVDALADAMERLVKDRPLAERLGQSGRAKVTRELDIEHWNDLLADRLRQLAGGTHASA
jgi:colanic acid/amylovoran biosynthesis glycosyltransferase